jgi:preprotein translocase subunit SecA
LGVNVFQTWRLERQLRGRSGRQGDPGESAMFHGIDDPEFRPMFGTGIGAKMVDKVMRGSDEPASNRLIQVSLERFLRRAADIASATLIAGVAYDTVFDEQRDAVHRRREAAVRGADLRAEITAAMERLIDEKLAEAGHDLPALRSTLTALIPLDVDTAERDALCAGAQAAYRRREAELDARHGDGSTRELERRITRAVIDAEWRRHLRDIEDLPRGAAIHQIAGRDPLIAYRRDAADLFADMIRRVDEAIVDKLFHIDADIDAD